MYAFTNFLKTFYGLFKFQLFSKGKLYLSTSLISSTALHIETISLIDGTYELIQEPDGDFSEAQANIVELTEVPNPDSEEPKPTDKPRCIILLFQIIQLIVTTYLCI